MKPSLNNPNLPELLSLYEILEYLTVTRTHGNPEHYYTRVNSYPYGWGYYLKAD